VIPKGLRNPRKNTNGTRNTRKRISHRNAVTTAIGTSTIMIATMVEIMTASTRKKQDDDEKEDLQVVRVVAVVVGAVVRVLSIKLLTRREKVTMIMTMITRNTEIIVVGRTKVSIGAVIIITETDIIKMLTESIAITTTVTKTKFLAERISMMNNTIMMTDSRIHHLIRKQQGPMDRRRSKDMASKVQHHFLVHEVLTIVTLDQAGSYFKGDERNEKEKDGEFVRQLQPANDHLRRIGNVPSRRCRMMQGRENHEWTDMLDTRGKTQKKTNSVVAQLIEAKRHF
jgi:hypothetical protein